MASYYLQEVFREVSVSVRKEFDCRIIVEGQTALSHDPRSVSIESCKS